MSLGLDNQMVLKGLKLLHDKWGEDPNYQHNIPRLDEQIAWFEKPEYTHTLRTQPGGHLGAIRHWMQCKFVNGSDVTWGSQTTLRGDFHPCPAGFEELACMIAAAVLNDIKGLR